MRVEDPSPAALYEYADAYLELDGWEGQREGRRALLRILDREPTYGDAFDRWAALYPDRDEMAEVARELSDRVGGAEAVNVLAPRAADLWIQLGEPSEAARVLDLWRRAAVTASPAWHYWRARILFVEGREAEATAAFAEGLAAAASAASAADLAPYRRDLEPLLGPDDLAALAALDERAQAGAIRAFWETRDLTPFSPANERLAEHYRRLAEVRRRYLWKKPLAKEKTIGPFIDDLGRPSFDTRAEGRSVDDRGTLYLLHGEPDRRHVELGGAEFWSYRRPDLADGRLQFHFKRMDGAMAVGNDAVYSIAPTTGLGLGNVRRGHELEEGVANTRLGLSADSWSEDSRQPLRVAVRPYAFRNAADPSLTDVVLAVEVESRADARERGEPDEHGRPGRGDEAGEGAAGASLVRRVRLYGDGFAVAEEAGDTVRMPHASETSRRSARSAGTIVLPARVPGVQPYALQVDEPATGAFGAVRGQLETPSLAGAGPRLSSIVIGEPVGIGGPPQDEHRRRLLRRGDAALRPLLAPRASRSSPLQLLYEAYGIQAGMDGVARYRIEYRLASAEERPGPLSRLLGRGWSGEDGEVAVAFEQERAGPVDVSVETFSLDTSALEPGPYTLTVAVLDRTTGREAERSAELEVTE